MIRKKLLNLVLKSGVKPVLGNIPNPERLAHQLTSILAMAVRVPKGVVESSADIAGPASTISLDIVRRKDRAPHGTLLFLHGGGYVAGSPVSYRDLTGRLALASGARVVAPDYRLAPNAPCPAAYDDVRAVFDHLVAEGTAPGDIVIGGDSAGGGLALALLAGLLADGIRPGGAMLFSPWTDMTLSGASVAENAENDVLLPAWRARELVELVTAGCDPADWRLSPLFADWHDPPPCYFAVSDTEILLDDTRRVAEKLRAAGGEVTIEISEDAPHVLPIFAPVLDEAQELLEHAAAFVKDRLTARPSPDES